MSFGRLLSQFTITLSKRTYTHTHSHKRARIHENGRMLARTAHIHWNGRTNNKLVCCQQWREWTHPSHVECIYLPDANYAISFLKISILFIWSISKWWIPKPKHNKCNYFRERWQHFSTLKPDIFANILTIATLSSTCDSEPIVYDMLR